VNRRCVFLLLMLVGVGLVPGGCGTTGPAIPSYDPNRPQIFLAGAEVDQAKSLAMGSAVSKGWKIVESSDSKLVVGRPLDVTAAASAVGEPVSTATVEVTTDFFKRQGGVSAVVGAVLDTDRGTKAARRIDFTESYKDELNRSLESLLQSWDENRWRVAAATPPSPTKIAPPEDEGTATSQVRFKQALEEEFSRSAEGTPAVVENAPVADSATESVPAASTASAWSAPAPAVAAPVAAASASPNVAPVEERYVAATPPPLSTDTRPASTSENMLVLNRAGERGVWGYYAEYYAKTQGCDVAESGAVLQQKQPEFEIHRVYCENGQSLLVKCNAGTCLGME